MNTQIETVNACMHFSNPSGLKFGNRDLHIKFLSVKLITSSSVIFKSKYTVNPGLHRCLVVMYKQILT